MTSPSSSPFGLVVRFKLQAGRESDFDQLTAATVPLIQQLEPGTLLYLCQRVEGKPNERIFYELYRDRIAFETHEAQAHTKRFLAERGPMLDSFDVDFLSPESVAGAWVPSA